MPFCHGLLEFPAARRCPVSMEAKHFPAAMKIGACHGDDASDGQVSIWSVDAGFGQGLVQHCREGEGLFSNVQPCAHITAIAYRTSPALKSTRYQNKSIEMD